MLFHLLTAATEAPVVENLTDAGMVGAAGYAVVFVGIALLIAVMVITSKIMQRKKPEEEAAPAAAPEAPAAPVAPGSAGKLKLYDTDPKTAAMIMAIVADKMGKPINELRFISIKEVKNK